MGLLRTALIAAWAMSAMGVGALAAPNPAAAAAPACQRACLIGAMDDYLAALVAHDPARVRVGKGFKATLNGRPFRLGDDVWKTAAAVDHRQYFADPAMGQVALFGVAVEDGKNLPMMVRLKLVDGAVAENEIILSKAGEGQLSARGPLPPINTLYDQALAPAERVSRDILAAVGNQYFDALVSHNGEAVPWDTTCNRLENYVQMTNDMAGASPLGCQDGVTHYMYHIKDVPNRRVVILDVERGLCMIIAQLDRRDPQTDDPLYLERARRLAAGRAAPTAQPNAAPAQPYKPTFLLLAELFKIRNGKIRDIQATLYTQEPHAPTGWN